MVLKKAIMIVTLGSVLFTTGCSSIAGCFDSKKSLEQEVILQNKAISFNNMSKINKVLKHLKGSNYYRESNVAKEYDENVLFVKYAVNNNLGESDYINFWNDTDKKNIVISNSVYMFLLIDDLDKIQIKLSEPIDEEFTINRNDLEEVYGMALENYNIDEESLSKLITKDKIEELWYLVNG